LEHLHKTVDLCREYDILCVADESYADIYQEERPHSLLEAGVEGMLVLHSLSKRSGMTGYRSGFLAGDADLIGRLKSFRSNPGLVPQDFVNAAAQVAWSDDTHVAARRATFTAKKALFLDFFKEVDIEVVGSSAGIYIWFAAPAGYNDETYCEALLNAGIVLSAGRMFGVAGGGKGYLRLALVPHVDECRKAIVVWRELINS